MAARCLSLCACSLLLALFGSADAASRQLDKENILINVTAVGDSGQETHRLQINFNISVVGEQILVNDIPVKLSGVTRLTCQALLLNSSSENSSRYAPGVFVTAVTRVLVRQWPLESDSRVELLVFNEEVIEVEGKKVQQPDMHEVNILMNKNFQKLRQSTYSYPLPESMLFSIPRESDVVVTDPNSPGKAGDQDILHTTSHYPLKQAETTQEEVAAPGKLPETPLRMDPAPWYEEDTTAEEGRLPDKLLPETPLRSESLSSYNALCRWVEDLRDKLRQFWAESLPIFFLVMWVVVVGVAGSAVIIKMLDVVFPSCDHKGILTLSPVMLVPKEDEQCLLENCKVDVQEEKQP
ncbi:glycoprotein integral membrane protein 1 [Paramormyrops kingsleyae]|uniref:Glycoprotein integral membrane 1 n=1 Tax=Paramormyrops kingsleyae TaxID=1676925 RepID=A0A3B3Q5S7_9TELE|nr:glycoprotein integral membrane protein 1 [Paramormyrops kingsleyae]